MHFLLLAGISFLLAFNYYIVRALKDTLMVTAVNAGAEALPFVKVWILLPASCVLALSFAWLSNRFPFRTTFTTIISFFIFGFALFAFVLFPNREALHPHTFATQLLEMLPVGWRALAAVIENWTYAFFYVMAENWSPIVYSVLFWGFTNEMTKEQEARRYYPWLTLAGTTAALVAGPVAIYLSQDAFNPLFPFGKTPWEQSLYSLTTLVIICGLGACGLFWLVCPKEMKITTKSDKPKLSFRESMHYLARSKELLFIALIGLTYNMMINLSEVVWKNEVLRIYSNPSAFNTYMSTVMLVTGILSTLITLFVTRPSLRILGWTKSALITPITALITSSLFFALLVVNNLGIHILPLGISVLSGSLHVCLSCSGKYTLFDTTKELAYIPLDSQTKLQGKAAIDGVGSRIGKAGGSLFIQTLLIVLPTISACVPFIGALLIACLLICIRGVLGLGALMEPKSAPAHI